MRSYILLFFTVITLPLVSGEYTLNTIDAYWKISYEITNTNPYTVFVVMPYNINFSNVLIKLPKDFTTLNVSGFTFTNQDYGEIYTTLNEELGFWVPPYTTVKIHRDGILSYMLIPNIPDNAQNEFRVAGPAIMNNITIFDEKERMKLLHKEGVKIKYKLYVRGKFLKSKNSNVVSMVIPAPLVLKNYHTFNKIVGKGDVDIWVDSYNDYIRKHEKISYKMHPELYDNVFNDDTLIPKMLTEPDDDSMNIKLFDVPAMVFTTSDDKPIEFSYVMYSYDTPMKFSYDMYTYNTN
ncbi:hypothetical protein KKP97_05860 [Methanothermococcus sp. SCGC AD-155-C09]|nr:hypothetical protein [Methanothermococcus sp. SCGC AD-155-C09]